MLMPGLMAGQGEVGDEVVVNPYEYHLTYDIFGATNGWRLGFQYRDRYNRYIMGLYEVSLGEVYHEKEFDILNPYYRDARDFSFGKTANSYMLRSGLGMLNQIYGKFDKGSVSVHYYYSIGPSIALLKPVYYEIIHREEIILYGEVVEREYIEEERIRIRDEDETDYHTIEDIKGDASYFKGFDEITARWGLYLKAGYSFDYSATKNRIHCIEVGAMAEAFTQSFEILDNKPSQFFFSLFLGYRFGFVKDKTVDPAQEYID